MKKAIFALALLLLVGTMMVGTLTVSTSCGTTGCGQCLQIQDEWECQNCCYSVCPPVAADCCAGLCGNMAP